jgi:hypothetical protein
VPTDAPTPVPTAAPTCKQVAVPPVDTSACHPICLWNKAGAKANNKIEGSVKDSQCTNCFCAGCDSKLFDSNCGGVYPTVASCSASPNQPGMCCPKTCYGGEFNIREKMCTDCKCAGCLAALFGNNCGGKVPAACDA